MPVNEILSYKAVPNAITTPRIYTIPFGFFHFRFHRAHGPSPLCYFVGKQPIVHPC